MEEAELVFDLMRENMGKILLFQKHMMATMSAKYPSIGFDTVFDTIDFVYNHPKFISEIIPRA